MHRWDGVAVGGGDQRGSNRVDGRGDNTVANTMVVGGGNHRSVNSVGGEVLGVSLSLSRHSNGKKNLGETNCMAFKIGY